jgi:Mg-chelatase subunit ChlD
VYGKINMRGKKKGKKGRRKENESEDKGTLSPPAMDDGTGTAAEAAATLNKAENQHKHKDRVMAEHQHNP